nr:pseudouridine synthase [Kofleriaceae bacterium]
MSTVRLQKFLADGGIAARRKSEVLITEGRVMVNGRVVKELGSKVDPARDRVTVDGEAVVALEHFYVIFNKPKGCITALTDDRDRPVVMDYLPNLPIPVKPVGRLDFYTEGLLLLTNDGELASRLLSAGYHVPKTYHAKIRGTITPQDLERLRTGVRLDDGTVTMPAEVAELPAESRHSWIALTIYEGKQRQIHRMFEALGFEVQKLQRVAFASLTFHGLRVGDARELTQLELNELRDVVELDHSAAARGVWRVEREDTDITRRARAKQREERELARLENEAGRERNAAKRVASGDDDDGDFDEDEFDDRYMGGDDADADDDDDAPAPASPRGAFGGAERAPRVPQPAVAAPRGPRGGFGSDERGPRGASASGPRGAAPRGASPRGGFGGDERGPRSAGPRGAA